MAGSARPIDFAIPDVSDDDVRAVERVLRSGWITTGQECLLLEQELAGYLEGPHVVTMASCTAALETTFAFLDLPVGARVGVPTWTFVASALAPMRTGATPVLLDIDPETLNISAGAVEAALEEGLDALVVVHFGGIPVDKVIHDLCRAAAVPIVEDAAHAFGARDFRGPLAGRGSTSACFSFYATKNLTSGEGGALATSDERLADFARSYRLHGLSRDAWARYVPGNRPPYELISAGIKANLSDVLAALARSQLIRFPDSQVRRRELVKRYRANLGVINGLRCVPRHLSEDGADHLMIVLLPEGVRRADIVQRLADKSIGSSVHFQPLHHFKWLHARSLIGATGTAVADSLAPRALSLPMHLGLTLDDVDRVCTELAASISG